MPTADDLIAMLRQQDQGNRGNGPRLSSGAYGVQGSYQRPRQPGGTNPQAPYGMSVFGGTRGYQHAGGAEGGIVGAPDLGRVSELNRYSSQVPGGAQYLQSIGMMPQVSTSQWSFNTGQGGKQPYQAQGTPVPGAMGQGTMGQGFSGLQNQLGGMGNISRNQSPFEQQIQGGISNMMNSPLFNKTQSQMMRNQAAEPIAGQQQINEQRTREDAIRRGASGSQGDADIRDQLNRVSAQGAKDQQSAQFDVDKYLTQLNQQRQQFGIQSGTGLLGQQLGDIRSIRDLLVQLEALNQFNGPQGSVNMILGGR